jgi:hypothetical protein
VGLGATLHELLFQAPLSLSDLEQVNIPQELAIIIIIISCLPSILFMLPANSGNSADRPRRGTIPVE